MNPELRLHFGKVAYRAAMKENGPAIGPWEDLSDHAKELYCAVGEAVASELAGMLIPTFRQVLESFLSTIENFSPRNKSKEGQENT
jgi:hypothetical protein